MAGTFNSKTGYLTVTGINVSGGNFVLDGNIFDSEMILGMINTQIADMNIDSDTVKLIAQNVHLNDLIDSDGVNAIATAVFASNNIDSDVINAIAVAAQSQIQTNINEIDSDVGYAIARNLVQDSEIQVLKSKYAVILTNDGVQDASITQLQTDITNVNARLTQNDSDHVEVEADVSALYTRMTAAETSNFTLDARVDTLDTTVGITGSGGHADRITTLEADLAALQATVAALTLNDLADVDTTGATINDALVWDGTRWSVLPN